MESNVIIEILDDVPTMVDYTDLRNHIDGLHNQIDVCDPDDIAESIQHVVNCMKSKIPPAELENWIFRRYEISSIVNEEDDARVVLEKAMDISKSISRETRKNACVFVCALHHSPDNAVIQLDGYGCDEISMGDDTDVCPRASIAIMDYFTYSCMFYVSFADLIL